MKLAIMQPYLFPYLGYFQLINAVDMFIVYDNIEYTKKGWINRNRIRLNDSDHLFTVPIKKDSDSLKVDQRYLPEDTSKDINKILAQIKSTYAKAPHFDTVYSLVKQIFTHPERNLFRYIYHSLTVVNQYIGIQTPLSISSSLQIDHELKGKDKVIALCKSTDVQTYINPIGGLNLYNREDFNQHGIDLRFHKMNDIIYPQGNKDFIKSLSIIDVMMFNSQEQLQHLLEEYTLI